MIAIWQLEILETMEGEEQEGKWPLPKFYFTVDWGSMIGIPFQEISGLDIGVQPTNYRHGNSPVFSKISMPGLVKNYQVTMKKGIFADDKIFWAWYEKIRMNALGRQNLVIKLLDESGTAIMTWKLTSAWPTKITSTDLKADTGEVAIESIEISHEGLTIENS